MKGSRLTDKVLSLWEDFKSTWYIWLIIVWFVASCGTSIYTTLKNESREAYLRTHPEYYDSIMEEIRKDKELQDAITFIIEYLPDSSFHYFTDCYNIPHLDSCILSSRKDAKEKGFHECWECSDNKEFIEKYGEAYRKQKEEEELEDMYLRDHEPHTGISRIDP